MISSCSVMISVSVSTSILEAQLLHKPVISIPIVDYKLGIPKIFKDDSCIVCNSEDFEDELKNILNSDKIKQEVIEKGNHFVKKWCNYFQ